MLRARKLSKARMSQLLARLTSRPVRGRGSVRRDFRTLEPLAEVGLQVGPGLTGSTLRRTFCWPTRERRIAAG